MLLQLLMAPPPAFSGVLAEALITADSNNLRLLENGTSGPELNLEIVAAVMCGLSYDCRLEA